MPSHGYHYSAKLRSAAADIFEARNARQFGVFLRIMPVHTYYTGNWCQAGIHLFPADGPSWPFQVAEAGLHVFGPLLLATDSALITWHVNLSAGILATASILLP